MAFASPGFGWLEVGRNGEIIKLQLPRNQAQQLIEGPLFWGSFFSPQQNAPGQASQGDAKNRSVKELGEIVDGLPVPLVVEMPLKFFQRSAGRHASRQRSVGRAGHVKLIVTARVTQCVFGDVTGTAARWNVPAGDDNPIHLCGEAGSDSLVSECPEQPDSCQKQDHGMRSRFQNQSLR